jgi:hypothetical protein
MSDLPAVEQRADTGRGREQLASYRYTGGTDVVDVVVDGVGYSVERHHEVKVRAGALDDHPDFSRVNRQKAKTDDKPADKPTEDES